MSVEYLQLIPEDPYYIPPTQAQSVAQEELFRLLPRAAEISMFVYDTAQFIDQGENFESVSCPFCSNDLRNWWRSAMNTAYKTLFENLSVTLPCCHEQTSLNNLRYQMPAGFARFVLSARNPDFGRNLTDDELEPIERVLNCKIKQIWARY
jgi:hypothetical protein